MLSKGNTVPLTIGVHDMNLGDVLVEGGNKILIYSFLLEILTSI
jgi:hypothetical protein